MYKKILDQFFKKNTVKNDKLPSAQAIAHFHIELQNNPEADEKIQGLLNEEIFKSQKGREEKVSAEKSEIESSTDYAQIDRLMRHNVDPMNQHILVEKAMEFEDEIISFIIKRLKTSLNDGYIETAIRILAKSEKNMTEELIENFDDTRNPYAQSMILVLLGFKADDSCIPWLIEQYEKLKKLYPNETFHDGAYYALDEIDSRFYFQK